MKRLYFLKIVFVILLAVFSVQQLSAKYWYRCQVEAKCKDTEGNIRDDIGFVAVKFNTQPTTATKRADLDQTHTGVNANYSYCTITAYVLARGDGNWQFDHWELEDGTRLSNSNQETGTASHTYRSTNKCPSTSSNGNHPHANYYTEHTFYAIFKEIVTQAVYAEVQPENLGEVKYLKENTIGDEITLRTYTLDYHNKFVGWVKQGDEDNIITTDRVLNFTITNETKGTYIAKYDNGYDFVRFKNYATGRYMDFTNDEGSLDDLTSLELKLSLNDVVAEAGSVIQIVEGDVKGSSGSWHKYFDYYMQNSKASKFYDFDPTSTNPTSPSGQYLRMPHDVDINVDTWALCTSDNVQSGIRIGDQNGAPHGYLGKRDEADWYIEPMDKDLETCENYFSLDPTKLVAVDGKYYTTLRTSWNILFNPEQMTPYVVTKVNDEQNGTFEMTPLTGNIIPAGTPVIIETKSADIEENRMVPTMTAASDAVPSGNLLKVSEKYFPNQSAPVENCKGLTVKDGQLAFGGDALSTVNGNEAYLSVANDVILPNKIPNVTLAELLQSGDTEKTYCVTDLTCVYARGKVLYCKDDNNAIRRSEMNEGEIDYVNEKTDFHTGNWDQSNWIAVKLPSVPSEAGSSYFDHRLTNVVGRLTNVVNPELEVTTLPTVGAENPYSENTYITCNFSGSHQSVVTSSGLEHDYYFVEPKPMEIAYICWALWNGVIFVKPSNSSSDLKGEFAADFSFSGEPSSAGVYNFPALIKIAPTAQGVMPRAQDEATKSWLVFPLELANQPVTAIDSLQSGKTTVKVVYYNLMGVESAVPHNGVNIVETRYSDGTRTTTKIIR